MDDLLGLGDAIKERFADQPRYALALLETRHMRVACRAARLNAERIAFVTRKVAELGLADPSRVLQHGLEDWLELAGRAGDDLQDLRGRGLLLQRLAQVARARLHLVEQPHVLDRDHRLVGEGGGQLDLLVGERPHRSASRP